MQIDSKVRFCKANKNNNRNNNKNNNLKGECTMMNRNNKEMRMETLKQAGINTGNFFNLNMNLPIGADVQVLINGVPYTITSDPIAQKIMNDGYVYNVKTDGRWVCAKTFEMLNEKSYNHKTRQYEYGWDAYLRNRFGYMYQFEMMLEELHRLSKMEKSYDPEFELLKNFFTKEVVVETCYHHVRQLKKFIAKQPTKRCKGVPYVTLSRYGHVFIKDLNRKVYIPLNNAISNIYESRNYKELECNLRAFMNVMVKLPFETPKCSQWKDAFKGNGAFKTLNNIIKHHGCVVQNYETGELLDRDESLAYVNSLIDTYSGAYWKYHELLKTTIKLNNFDLKESIEAQNK